MYTLLLPYLLVLQNKKNTKFSLSTDYWSLIIESMVAWFLPAYMFITGVEIFNEYASPLSTGFIFLGLWFLLKEIGFLLFERIEKKLSDSILLDILFFVFLTVSYYFWPLVFIVAFLSGLRTHIFLKKLTTFSNSNSKKDSIFNNYADLNLYQFTQLVFLTLLPMISGAGIYLVGVGSFVLLVSLIGILHCLFKKNIQNLEKFKKVSFDIQTDRLKNSYRIFQVLLEVFIVYSLVLYGSLERVSFFYSLALLVVVCITVITGIRSFSKQRASFSPHFYWLSTLLAIVLWFFMIFTTHFWLHFALFVTLLYVEKNLLIVKTVGYHTKSSSDNHAGSAVLLIFPIALIAIGFWAPTYWNQIVVLLLIERALTLSPLNQKIS